MRYFIVCGETSGDTIGGQLTSSLNNIDPQANIAAWGGSSIQSSGAHIYQDIEVFGMMGFQEVAKNIFRLFQLLERCKKDIKEFQPDVVILIDFSGFNRRLLPWLKRLNTKIVYYSPPKVWASRSYRVKSLCKYVDLTIVLFPFEYDFLKGKGLKVEYFGNPIVQSIKSRIDPSFVLKQNKKIGALIPGSRIQEITQVLPVMIAAALKHPNYEWYISCMSKIGSDLYKELIPNRAQHIHLICDQHLNLLHESDMALVTSGTATLEATLLDTPQIVCYKTATINYWIAKTIIKVPFISLPNLIANKRIVPELIQKKLTTNNLTFEIKKLEEIDAQNRLKSEYGKIRSSLTTKNTMQKTAKAIFRLLN